MKKLFYLLLILLLTSQQLTAQWNAIKDFGGDGRDGAASFVINGIAYVGAGILSKDFWSYDATNNSWTQKSDFSSARSFAASFSSNGKGYIVGGDLAFGQATNEVWEYDPVNDNWIQKANFPGGNRVGMFVLQFGDRIFIGGGTNSFTNQGYGTIYKDFYEYLPATDTWVTLPDLPKQIAFASGFVINSKGYFCLGANNNSSLSKELYELDSATKTWTKKADFPATARDGGIAFSLNNKGYVGLGQSSFTTTYSDVYEYNPTTNSWAAIQSYPNNKTGWATAFVLGTTAYVGTGATVNLDFSKQFYTFSTTNTGLHGVSNNLTNIYPNPFTNTINLSSLPQNSTVTLTDINGKEILKTNTTTSVLLSTTHLKSGLYLLHTELGTIKMIK